VGKNTRIYDRFDWWSVADCSCEFCLYWKGPKRGCSLMACACDDVRQEAVRREQAAAGGVPAPEEVVPCRG